MKNAADASATSRETEHASEHAPKNTARKCYYLKIHTTRDHAAKGTLEWWTTIFSDPSEARRYWNVYSTLVSEPSAPVK